MIGWFLFAILVSLIVGAFAGISIAGRGIAERFKRNGMTQADKNRLSELLRK